jgi:Phosphodiester glycosidase/FlgD Ig-like domain
VVARVLIGGLLALVLAAPAAAQRSQLLPGVTYEQGVQFTPHGPVALHVVTAPRPTGLYALKPVLSNDTVEGRETVTAMQRRTASSATSVAINADLFNVSNGRPSGVFMRDRVLASPPHNGRSSIGITEDGTLDVRRVEFFATWRGFGQRRTVTALNQPPGPNGIAVYTTAWGRTTPAAPGAVTAVLRPLPPAAPNTDLQGQVVEVRNGSPTAIPPDGAVLVARGTAGQRLREEAPLGSWVTLRLIFRPSWDEVASAVGGGPVLVRNGTVVFRSFESFDAGHLLPRNPRTAVGQLADGRILLVVTDGRQPGYSVGMTNFELAQTMARLGAVRASGLDAGGSSTLAFEGELLNRPSDRTGERAVASSLQLQYFGAYVAPPAPVVSPNGDGIAERQTLSYKVVRPSVVTATLTAPDGAVAWTEQQVQRAPGRFTVPFPPGPAAAQANLAPPAEGTWKLQVQAVDDAGQASQATQSFTVNNTLSELRLTPGRLVVREGGTKQLRAGVSLARAATVTVTVETSAGVPVARLLRRRVEPGRLLFSWDGRTAGGLRLAYGGEYLLRAKATNELGTVELTRTFGVLRAAPLAPKAPQKRG